MTNETCRKSCGAIAAISIITGLCLLALAFTGCRMAWTSDKITEESSSGLGAHMRIPSQAGGGGAIAIDLGIIRHRVKITPTSTNGPVYAARTLTTFQAGNSVNPIATDMIENDMTGDVEIGTNSTGRAVIPKVPAPVTVLRPPNAPR